MTNPRNQSHIRYLDAALSGMEPIYIGVGTEHKKYVFMAAGKFLHYCF